MKPSFAEEGGQAEAKPSRWKRPLQSLKQSSWGCAVQRCEWPSTMKHICHTMATWSFGKIDYFPKALAFSLSFALLSALIIATVYQDVSIYLPYISEAGSKPPASKIFSISLNITVILCSTTIILRYMIVEIWDRATINAVHKWNIFAATQGLLSMLGMSIVAAFPVSTTSLHSVFEIHFLGAFMLFGFSMVYGFTQSYISYKFCPMYNSLFICRLRLGIMILCSFTSLIIVVGGAVGFKQFGPSTEDHWSGKKTPEDPGFIYLFISSLAEWLQTVCFIIFYLTLYPEFKRVSVNVNVQYCNSTNKVQSTDCISNGILKSKTL